jgi:hypothetical protein
MARSLETVAVNHMTAEQARMIVRRELQAVVDKMIRAAHKQGARGRKARAEHCFEGALLDASIRLRGEFEAIARACVGSDVWHVSFGYTLVEHAPGIMMVHLK